MVWDKRMPRVNTDDYHLTLKDEYVEYYLSDMNKNMKGQTVNVYFRWEQMAVIGPYYSGKVKIGEFKVPDRYLGDQSRKYSPGPRRKHNY